MRKIFVKSNKNYTNAITYAVQTTLKDPLHVTIRPIIRSRVKKVKETFNELIQNI
jgi:hypothetical protein